MKSTTLLLIAASLAAGCTPLSERGLPDSESTVMYDSTVMPPYDLASDTMMPPPPSELGLTTSPEASQPTTKWSYESREDQMGDVIKTATVACNEPLYLSSPYDGGVTAWLIARKAPKYGTDLMFRVSKGQIFNRHDDLTARIRFDDQKPLNVGYSEAADGSSEVIFFDGAANLIKKMQAAKKVVVEIQFYQDGNKQIAFDVSGLKWPIPEKS